MTAEREDSGAAAGRGHLQPGFRRRRSRIPRTGRARTSRTSPATSCGSCERPGYDVVGPRRARGRLRRHPRAEARAAPAVVFNLCESLRGDNRFEALMPMLLDFEGLVYTGSPPSRCSRPCTRTRPSSCCSAPACPRPGGDGRRPGPPDSRRRQRLSTLRFPLIVKPTREDASVGIASASVVRTRDQLASGCATCWPLPAARPGRAVTSRAGRSTSRSSIGPRRRAPPAGAAAARDRLLRHARRPAPASCPSRASGSRTRSTTAAPGRCPASSPRRSGSGWPATALAAFAGPRAARLRPRRRAAGRRWHPLGHRRQPQLRPVRRWRRFCPGGPGGRAILRGPGPAAAGAGPEETTRCGHDPPCQAIARR